MIPIPPTQCESDRQNRSVLGVVSREVIMVKPVPVQPDIASKTASVEDIPRPKTNGRAPTNAMASHARATALIVIEKEGSISRYGRCEMPYPSTKNVTGAVAMG